MVVRGLLKNITVKLLSQYLKSDTGQSIYYATGYNTILVITWPGLGSQMVIFL